jgi:hypothetical protein
MALITQASDPVLWGTLKAICDEDEASGRLCSNIQKANTLYVVMQNSVGEVAFLKKDNMALIDSRSFTNSRPASYKKLDA